MMNRRRIICFLFLIFLLLYYIILYFQIEKREQQEKLVIDSVLPVTEEDNTIYEQSGFVEYKADDKKKDNADDISNKGPDPACSSDSDDTGTLPAGFDCIISIPAIQLNKIVYTGLERNTHLTNYELITSATDMEYGNGGNYIICGHASRLYGHSLNRLREIQVGDEVWIWNNNRRDQYYVSSITYEHMKDTSNYCQQTEYRQITIISCAKYIAKDRYIVIKCKQLK